MADIVDRLVVERDIGCATSSARETMAAAAGEIGRLRGVLQQIARMTTMPSHPVNTVTLIAARAIAREALGHEGTEMVRPQITG